MPSELRTLHDQRNRPRGPAAIVKPSPMFDLILVLWSALGADDKVAAHELGKGWFDRFRSSLSSETRTWMAEVGGDYGELWLNLLGILEQAPSTDPEAMLTWLGEQDGRWLRRQMLGAHCAMESGADPKSVEADLDAAAAGDLKAADRLLEGPSGKHIPKRKRTAIHRLLTVPEAEVAARLASTLRSIRSDAYLPFERQWAGPLTADATATRAKLAKATSLPALIEDITKGITFDMPVGVARLVLIPTVSLRPWTLVTDHESTMIVCYPVDSEHLAADPDAPPGWLLEAYKALADENRLRILRLISLRGSATLAELTEHLGLAKSTVHHHLAVLRGAGLLRVQLDPHDNASYALRLEALPDAGRSLDGYLNTPDEKGAIA
jgi:DNA-binding transcriptional ArsR family regulator